MVEHIRYRYTVKHKKTGKVHKLGAIHLEQHTGLDSETVRLIVRGLKRIDLERDEILSKIIDKWKLPFFIPPEVEVPKDMVEQIRVGLPLLDRQIKRLKIQINCIKREREKVDWSKLSSVYISNNMVKQKRFIPRLEEEISSKALSQIKPVYLYNKLRAFRITADEARLLYLFAKNTPFELKNYGLDIDDIIKAASKALGHISVKETRKWLLDLKEL